MDELTYDPVIKDFEQWWDNLQKSFTKKSKSQSGILERAGRIKSTIKKEIKSGMRKTTDTVGQGIGYTLGFLEEAIPVDITKARSTIQTAVSWLGGTKLQNSIIAGIESKAPRIASTLRAFQRFDKKLAAFCKSALLEVTAPDRAAIRVGLNKQRQTRSN